MQRTTKLLFAAIGAIAAVLSSPAFAGGSIKDAPVAAPFSWTGFYLGGHAGWARSDIGTGAANFVQPDTDGGIVGGHIGFNWQLPSSSLVIGIEADASALNLDAAAPCFNPAFTCGTDISHQSSIRGRLGLAANRWLLYVTAGVAFTDFDGFTRVNATGVTFPGGTSRNGFIAGLGAEYALTNNVIVGLEYLHTDFGSKDHTYDVLYPANDLKTDVVRARLSYKF